MKNSGDQGVFSCWDPSPKSTGERKMATIKIQGQSYELKYTIESWKQLKAKCDLTPNNFQEKFSQNLAETLGNAIYYGLSPRDRSSVKLEDIEVEHGLEVMDTLIKAIVESMPAKSKEAFEKSSSEAGGGGN